MSSIEPVAGNGHDVVAATAQPYKPSSGKKLSAKALETIELGKRLTPWISGFLKASLFPVVKDIHGRLKTLERDNLAVLHRLGAAESALADRSDISKLKKKLAEIEHTLATAMSFQGVWRQDHTFERGSVVSHGGSLWFAEKATDHRPGTPDSGWKLTVKHGSFSRE